VPFTTTFNSEGGYPGLGSFRVTFKPGTQHILGAYETRDGNDFGGPTQRWKKDTICITPTDIGQADRSEVLAASIFSGRAHVFGAAIGDYPWTVGGPTILVWLGDDDTPARGPGIDSYGSSSYTFAGYLDSFLGTGGHTGGLTYSYSGAPTGTWDAEIKKDDSARDKINKLVRTADCEYRMAPDGELLFGERGEDYAFRTTTPQVILTEGAMTGRDGDLWAFQIKSGRIAMDWGPEIAQVTAYSDVASPMWSKSFTLEASPGRGGKNFDGTTTNTTMALMGVDDEEARADLDAALYAQFRRMDRLRMQIDADVLAAFINTGDTVWVDAPSLWLWDPDQSINFAGAETHPIPARTAKMRCPIREGMGVYIIHNHTETGGTNAVERLTEFVQFETGPAELEFDPLPPTRAWVRGSRWRSDYKALR